MAENVQDSQPDTTWYRDDKGRKRWRRNDEVAAIVKKLGEYLIIGGYPEEHAKRYAAIAHSISRWPELIDSLAACGDLDTIPGVGGVITRYLEDIIRTGTTDKFNDDQYGKPPPRSVLELTSIDKLGPKTVRMLYQEHDIDSLSALCHALNDGRLLGIKGIGPKMTELIKARCLET